MGFHGEKKEAWRSKQNHFLEGLEYQLPGSAVLAIYFLPCSHCTLNSAFCISSLPYAESRASPHASGSSVRPCSLHQLPTLPLCPLWVIFLPLVAPTTISMSTSLKKSLSPARLLPKRQEASPPVYATSPFEWVLNASNATCQNWHDYFLIAFFLVV